MIGLEAENQNSQNAYPIAIYIIYIYTTFHPLAQLKGLMVYETKNTLSVTR